MKKNSDRSAAIEKLEEKLEQIGEQEKTTRLQLASLLRKPSLYRVVLHKDDYTPQDFIVWVVSFVFYKDKQESIEIVQAAETDGRSVIGVYTYDIATTKAHQVKNLAEEHEHPLICAVESVEGTLSKK